MNQFISLELNITHDRFQEKSGRQPFIDFWTHVKNTLILDTDRNNVLEN